MLINADFSRSALVTPQDYVWVPSPQGGVERVMLDRLGEEKGRATSIVRYAPESTFPRHLHPAGEEILVLSGTFSDESAHFPAGWYLRNPPGSSHAPSSLEGATIFVKLWQMDQAETQPVRIDTRDPHSWHVDGDRDVCTLFSNHVERVWLERVSSRKPLSIDTEKGAELFVVEGELTGDGRPLERGSWVRMPAAKHIVHFTSTHGAIVYVKTGHLPSVSTVS